MKNTKFTKYSIYFLIVLIPFFVTLLLTTNLSVNVPFMDEWELVKLFQKSDAGTLSFGDLWEQHNEHRMFFPKSTTVILGDMTRWNLVAQTILSIFLVLGILLTLAVYTKRDVKKPFIHMLYLLTISSLLFSYIQWENWIRGFQMQWFFCTFAGIFALYLLDKNTKFLSSNIRYIAAAAMCFVATFSLGSGLFFWAACFVSLLLNKQSTKKLLIWIALSLLSAVMYFYNYSFLERVASDIGFMNYVKFFFAYLGGALTFDFYSAVALGLVLTILSAVILYKALVVDKIKPNVLSLPLGLMIFVLMSDIVTMYSRAPVFGPTVAVASKYTTISILFIVALILICMKMPKLNRSNFTALVIASLCIPMVLAVNIGGAIKSKDLQVRLLDGRSCSRQDNPTDVCLSKLYPDPGVLRKRIGLLKRDHLAGY